MLDQTLVSTSTLVATSVEVDTSVWSSTFQSSYTIDSLGTFAITGGGDSGDFTVDAKTGKLTSNAAIVSGTGGSGNSPSDTPGTDGIGTAAVTNGQFQVQVTYTHRDLTTTHVETLQINVKNKTETTLDDLKIETAADAGRALPASAAVSILRSSNVVSVLFLTLI